ncbi:chromosomal replication initiator protein DnaA [Desulfocicer niacini]
MESFWKKVKLKMKGLLPDHSYRMWVGPMEFVSARENIIILSCPNPFSQRRVKDHYLAGIEKEFQSLGVKDACLELQVHDPKAAKRLPDRAGKQKSSRIQALDVSVPPVAPPPRLPRQLTLPGLGNPFDSGRLLKKTYTFDKFVVGSNNDFAYSASLSLAQGGANGNGALYLVSDTGLGKSHLSQAVGHHAIHQGVTNKVFYVTAEDFTNEMVSSLKNNRINSFKEKYRTRCDVLILEDVHFLSGKSAIQNELAMTLDYLLDAEKKLIFSGCYLPGEIPKMNEQLKSRLSLGLVTRIDAPDFKTRVKILRKKAAMGNTPMPGEVLDYLAQELCDNVRQLESGLSGVTAKASLMGEKIDINLARSVLSNISRSKQQITVDAIKDLVCREFKIAESDLVSASRKKIFVQPRQIAIYLARKYTDQPLKKIGRSFNRYHATAIYSINAVEKAMKKQGSYAEQMNYLYKKIETVKA